LVKKKQGTWQGRKALLSPDSIAYTLAPPLLVPAVRSLPQAPRLRRLRLRRIPLCAQREGHHRLPAPIRR
jgi:hypothetical protein